MGEVLIVGIVLLVAYNLISRQIEVKRLEAEARLRDGDGSDMDEVREELARIREMLADVLLDDHTRSRPPLIDRPGTDALDGR